jgi:hypothetical protein
MSLSAGDKLGPHEILTSIGAGGMGEVYKARDSRLNREVAVKVLPVSFAADEERLRRFRLEAQSAGSLNHPNILVVHDIGVQDGTPYLVSELLEGESLRERLKRGKLSVSRAIDFARQIAAGLAAAHARGIAHRDVKPENLFVTKDGRIKILDFGLAKIAPNDLRADSSETQTALTDPGKVVGTAAYMSPEQVRGQHLDHRSDIFSFGCVLYEMLTGQQAFRGNTAADTMSAVLKEEPPDPSALGSETLPALDRIVRHCLEKSPEERFQSARDIAFDLESISQTSQTGAKAAPQQTKRGWAVALVAAAVLLALVGGLAGGLELAKPPALKFHRLTYRRGKIHEARFAPDGHTVVYAAQWEDEPYQLFTVRDDGPESRPLGFSGAGLFAISPRSELALGMDLRSANTFVEEGTLAQAPFAGGAARPLINGVKFADWTPDGGELAAIRQTAKGWDIESPPGKLLYQGPAGGYLSDLRISPDGSHLAFLEHPLASSDGYVAMIDRRGQKKVLTPTFSGNAQGLAWSPKGDEVWFTATNAGSRNVLYAVTLNGRQRVVSSQVAQLVVEDIARDGRVLVTATLEYRSKLFARGPGDSRERELSGLDWSLIRDISSDGKLFTYDESGEGAGDSPGSYLRDVSTPAAVRIGTGQGPMLSPDG